MLLATLPLLGHADDPSGAVTLLMLEESDLSVPGVVVELRGPGNPSLVASAVSNASGLAELPPVPQGTYIVQIVGSHWRLRAPVNVVVDAPALARTVHVETVAPPWVIERGCAAEIAPLQASVGDQVRLLIVGPHSQFAVDLGWGPDGPQLYASPAPGAEAVLMSIDVNAANRVNRRLERARRREPSCLACNTGYDGTMWYMQASLDGEVVHLSRREPARRNDGLAFRSAARALFYADPRVAELYQASTPGTLRGPAPLP